MFSMLQNNKNMAAVRNQYFAFSLTRYTVEGEV